MNVFNPCNFDGCLAGANSFDGFQRGTDNSSRDLIEAAGEKNLAGYLAFVGVQFYIHVTNASCALQFPQLQLLSE